MTNRKPAAKTPARFESLSAPARKLADFAAAHNGIGWMDTAEQIAAARELVKANWGTIDNDARHGGSLVWFRAA